MEVCKARNSEAGEREALPCFFVAGKGKGSHGRLHLGSGFTTLKDRKKGLGKGLPMSAFTDPAKFSSGSDGRVLVEFVDLPRVATDSRNLSEAIVEAIDALGSDLSIRLKRRESIPPPSRQTWPASDPGPMVARSQAGPLSCHAGPGHRLFRTRAAPRRQ